MKASDLNNTPWTAKKRKDYPLGWEVKDSVGWSMATMIDEPTAKAIAALPETLKRLERLEEAARRAIKASSGSIYFNDRADYLKNHYDVVNCLYEVLGFETPDPNEIWEEL